MENPYEVRGDVTAIFLRKKSGNIIETLIDTEDLEKVSADKGTWCAQWSHFTKSFYVVKRKHRAKGMIEPPKKLLMHRIVTDCPEHLEPDHINHDTLDNRKQNLRTVTRSENLKNCNIRDHEKITKKIIGTLYWHKTKLYWVGRIVTNGKSIFQKCNKEKKAVEDLLAQKIAELKSQIA